MKTYKTYLSQKSINKTIKDIRAYQKRIAGDKCKKFCEKLAQKGIVTSYANSGQYGAYLIFTYTPVEQTNTTCKYVYVAKKLSDIAVTWKTGSAMVDPLLMAEFGSGWLADNKWGVSGVGQGTFPNQKHAFDSNGWFWEDMNGNKYHSYGESPTYPVHLAWLEMEKEILNTAKEVFKV